MLALGKSPASNRRRPAMSSAGFRWLKRLSRPARLPEQVSGGELQRFALVRVLLLDPAFLFADEATSRLDPVNQQHVITFLQEIVDETGLAVLLVTHDHGLAAKISTRLIALGGAHDKTA